MKNYRHRTILVFCACALSACATATFNVTSDPLQADVYFQLPGMTEKKPLGKTPLTMSNADLKAAIGPSINSGEFFPVIVERAGFKSETFQVPAARFGTMLTKLDVKLKPQDPEIAAKALEKTQEKNQDKLQEKTAKAMVDRLFLAQKFALTQQFERAHAELDRLIEDFPQFSRALSMRASIYYAQKNFPESLKWYEAALKVDPQMDDAVRMTAKIRGIKDVENRLPASASGGNPAALPTSLPPLKAPAGNK